ncbi:Tolloid-like protein 1 [Scytonema sp. UIC 10036]|uniref:beta/gamma crystallin-related protein n=1 Tax=Scytonema sp. UIC 10036 TaxID=2304196 RepID=UPI0012DA3EBC|nr:beta/gamma crystallin-related protein [Scytonema sp. UIC 10036]MUG91313.1 Tolloid-like protein 1 [Scytonema sp. UIC 10036]
MKELMSENTFEDIKICVEIPPDMSEEAQKIAFEENPLNAEAIDNSSDRIAVITGKKWQSGRTLRVRFLDGDPVVQTKIAAIAQQWTQYANIKLVFGNDPNAEIRISLQPGGSWSFLGTDALTIAKNQPTMNYGWLKPDSSDQEYLRVVLHEFGHALGCIHEHQHPQAGIPWNRDAVYRYYKETNNWDTEQVDNNIFRRFGTDITQFSQYDRESIMHYAIPKELTIGGFEVPWNTQLSVTDKNFMRQAYPGGTVGSNRVVIYSDSDFQGRSQELEPGRYDVGQIAIGNDHLSSLKVPSGLRVILYEHAGFQGRSKVFASDTPYVGDDFNDFASSLEIQVA